jgi:PilZ domain
VDTIERRSAERHPACDNQARFLWADGPEIVESPARLIDVSQGGAGFVSEVPPPQGRDVCFKLESPRKTGWILAHVVRSGESSEGGLSFSGYYLRHLIDSLT